MHPLPNGPPRGGGSPSALFGGEKFGLAQILNPAAELSDLFPQHVLLFGEGVPAIGCIELLVKAAQVVPLIPFGGCLHALPRLFSAFPVQQSAHPAKLVRQVFRRCPLAFQQARFLLALGNISKFGKVLL